MRKKRKIKWVVSLVVSFVLMMLAPAISNHPAHAKQSSAEENQTDKPWVTSLPFVTTFMEMEFSRYNNQAFGYERFEYLYLEDTLADAERIRQTHEKICGFFEGV